MAELNLEKELQAASEAAQKHYQQWQQDMGAINMLAYLIQKQKQEPEAAVPKLEVKE